ncbi:MAG TPA: secretion protein [Flavobacteriales bacterium]|jgi:hypothetical protein|nr:secretion protein [Flavobacteriales bacterium]
MRTLILVFTLSIVALNSMAQGMGPYHPGSGSTGNHAVSKDSSIIYNWASSCTVIRGNENISNAGTLVTSGEPVNATGPADGSVVSLGDGGMAILSFDDPFSDHLGYDFAVFENAFPLTNGEYFLELAYVEVSSDGINFFRFPAHSLTPSSVQIETFGALDPTNINNLAGKYLTNYGTPFDLAEVSDDPLLDKNSITHVRVIDVVGSIDSAFASYDTAGNVINDPFPTEFSSGGFDLDAVAVLNTSPSSYQNLTAETIRCFPQPASDVLFLKGNNLNITSVRCFGISGKLIFETEYHHYLDIGFLKEGYYVIEIKSDKGTFRKRILKS